MSNRLAYADTALPFFGPTADRMLDSPLSYWKGWELRTRCGHPGCPREKLLCVEDVLQARGEMTVRDLAGRLRCRHCQRPASKLAFEQDKPGGRVSYPVRRPTPMQRQPRGRPAPRRD
ncbi:hypothetical protein BKE38_03185 [Pseudoroseomonas deserti]|uniref:Uncharacterized protein n=1 Tax=Teichococcus deserti TaxID=1817963 RepID=A0A1V2H9C4_9PROT|nr:hypothetical protein [Pseudoroseomonas deserti]ONG58269.1 hypothetical protein BKE38_03185 [Pseudoroseomonas deserti]